MYISYSLPVPINITAVLTPPFLSLYNTFLSIYNTHTHTYIYIYTHTKEGDEEQEEEDLDACEEEGEEEDGYTPQELRVVKDSLALIRVAQRALKTGMATMCEVADAGKC